jgi:gluconate 2-dehydrogenase alpha chain
VAKSNQLKPVDVVVVGLGVAGTIVAKELADAGLRVVGLERGRMVDPAQDFAMPYAHDELKFDRHSELFQNLSRETITFRNTRNETALPMREIGSFKPGECVGGAGVTWGGITMRFLPWDFATRSRTIERYGERCWPENCTSQDWGISYDELEPYYDQFEQVYGVGGKAGNLNGEIQPEGNPFEGWRTRDYPNPPLAPTYTGALFAKASRTFGHQPFAKPSAAMTRPYTNPYRLALGQCVQGGFCNSHGCAMGAKASPLTAVLPALLKCPTFELRTRANAIRIDLDTAPTRAIGVTYVDAHGHALRQPADLVVLASYVFSNTRLLLLSGIGRPYDPASGSGSVGKNYAYQTTGTVQMFFDDKRFNRFMGGGGGGISIDTYNGDNFDHGGLGFIGGASIAANSPGATPIRSHPVPEGTPKWGSGWKQAVAQYYDRSMALSTAGGSQGSRGNYLDLDPTYRDAWGQPLLRLTFDWPANDIAMSSFVTDKAAEIARSLGPASMTVRPVRGPYSIVPYQSTHNTGGAIMGADPANSVVNKYLQSWDVPNVFVIGASAFPQNSANNPTGTVGALAYWACDAIKDRYLKQPGPMT